MRVRGLWRVRAALRSWEDARLRRSDEPTGVILMYHRVADLADSPYGTVVSPSHFAEHLDLIREVGEPLGLEACLRAIAAGKLPRRAIVVTFDDGYADNALNAAPLLAARGVPATLFVSGGETDADEEFWWDVLDWVCFHAPVLPATLRLATSEGRVDWEAGADAVLPGGGTRSWRLGTRDHPTTRHRLFATLHPLLLHLDPRERRRVVRELREWAGGPPENRPTHRRLSGEELRRLSRTEGITLGAHTLQHRPLDVLSRADCEDEITGNRDFLQEVTGHPVTTIAFPYGLYSAGTLRVVRRLGFVGACTSEAGAVSRGSDPLRLPRVHVPDEGAEGLARILARYC